MKKHCSAPPSLVLILSIFVFFFSCKKINEATTLGGSLVPEVDNITTFETSFDTETDNKFITDTSKLTYSDPVALGTITNDPEFGQTKASVAFQVNPVQYGTYPFSSKENFVVDSVILSLAYEGSYGDTITPQTVHVYEVAQGASFNDTTYYAFNHPPLETTGGELGSATFTTSRLKDSVPVIRRDTQYVANELRIRLNNAFGERLASYDTTTGTNGGFRNDTLFKNLFRGFALKTDEGAGNGLAYFSLSNTTKTRLTVYYRATRNGAIDTAEVGFIHGLRFTRGTVYSLGGQVNSINRTASGNWASYLTNGTAQDDKVYIQSLPGGSAAYVTIPGLDTFQNKLIHRAELVAAVIPSASENWFAAPDQLFVDRTTNSDSGFIFHQFLVQSSNTGLFNFDFASFGGQLQPNNTYKFNVTPAVQDIIARDSSNNRLRIYAPFDARPYDGRTNPASPLFVQAIPFPAYGRVVLAGGNYADPGMKMRLRVVYSNL